MSSNCTTVLLVVVLLLFAGFGASATSISDGVLQSHGFTGRSLLQAKQSCPVNFEFMNYTIITSQCKGPNYKANACCTALKEFGCPYAAQLNDLTNDCASTMFSYINLYGKYPPGLFAGECKEGKYGLSCAGLAPQVANNDSNSGHKNLCCFTLVSAICGILLHFLLI